MQKKPLGQFQCTYSPCRRKSLRGCPVSSTSSQYKRSQGECELLYLRLYLLRQLSRGKSGPEKSGPLLRHRSDTMGIRQLPEQFFCEQEELEAQWHASSSSSFSTSYCSVCQIPGLSGCSEEMDVEDNTNAGDRGKLQMNLFLSRLNASVEGVAVGGGLGFVVCLWP